MDNIWGDLLNLLWRTGIGVENSWLILLLIFTALVLYVTRADHMTKKRYKSFAAFNPKTSYMDRLFSSIIGW